VTEVYCCKACCWGSERWLISTSGDAILGGCWVSWDELYFMVFAFQMSEMEESRYFIDGNSID